MATNTSSTRTSVVAFVPVLHKGYFDFFKKHGGDLFLLPVGILPEPPNLSRDLRALPVEEMRKAILAMGIFSRVEIFNPKNLSELGEILVMPDEDISRALAEKFFPQKEIIFDSVFLRWDGIKTLNKNPVSPDRIISVDERDREIMGKAFQEAEKSADWWRQVGGALVKDGKILFTTHNKHMPLEQSVNINGDPRLNFDAGKMIEMSTAHHAEKEIVAQAAREGIKTEGASLYVTTFPCPNCAMDVATAGIAKVYYADGYSLLEAENTLRTFGVELIRVDIKN